MAVAGGEACGRAGVPYRGAARGALGRAGGHAVGPALLAARGAGVAFPAARPVAATGLTRSRPSASCASGCRRFFFAWRSPGATASPRENFPLPLCLSGRRGRAQHRLFVLGACSDRRFRYGDRYCVLCFSQNSTPELHRYWCSGSLAGYSFSDLFQKFNGYICIFFSLLKTTREHSSCKIVAKPILRIGFDNKCRNFTTFVANYSTFNSFSKRCFHFSKKLKKGHIFLACIFISMKQVGLIHYFDFE